MIQDRSAQGRALPAFARRAALVLVSAATVLAAGVQAQFPPPARPPKAAAAAPEAGLPPARSILDRHVEAIGGRAAVLKHTSTHFKGSVSMPDAGITGEIEVYGAAPNKSLLRIRLAGVGEVLEGFDGTYGWSLSPMTGPMLLEGRQLEEKRFDADYHGELRSSERYASMTTLERTEFDGRSCYKLRLVRKTGGEDIEFYDVATGLKAGSITTRETPMGTVTGTTVETDYRRFGRLLHPTTVRTQIGAVKQVVTITSIEFDNVPASVFELPAGIKALLR